MNYTKYNLNLSNPKKINPEKNPDLIYGNCTKTNLSSVTPANTARENFHSHKIEIPPLSPTDRIGKVPDLNPKLRIKSYFREIKPDLSKYSASPDKQQAEKVRSHIRQESLGVNTKYTSTSERNNLIYNKMHELRRLRYKLREVARQLYMIDGEKGYKMNRVAKCGRVKITESNIEVLKSQEHGKAFYSGLMQCGSVWDCPVCSAKITEKRKAEISSAFEWAYRGGNKVVMVTLTFPHYEFQHCRDLLDIQAKALKMLRSGRKWVDFKEEVGFKGLIRALEVTRGDNGWHPHTHEAWIVDSELSMDYLKRTILSRWYNICKDLGVLEVIPKEQIDLGFWEHAVNVKDFAKTSDYLGKWGDDNEMLQGAKKNGSGKHTFDLLADYADGHEKAGMLYLEYSQAFKGKRQIFWSRGLKKEVGIKNKTDQEKVEEQDDKAVVVCTFTPEQWRKILRYDARCNILSMVEQGCSGEYILMLVDKLD